MSRKKTEEKGMTYASSGVDIEEEGKAIRELVSALSFKRKGFGGAVDLSGHFTGLIDIGDSYLSMCTDGVGSKLEIARELEKWDTVGIDCMAMNVNDMICIGAEPLAFVDYIALEEPSARILSEIGKGLNEGARLSNLTIIGGETATLPDIVHGLDLAGTCLGAAGTHDYLREAGPRAAERGGSGCSEGYGEHNRRRHKKPEQVRTGPALQTEQHAPGTEGLQIGPGTRCDR